MKRPFVLERLLWCGAFVLGLLLTAITSMAATITNPNGAIVEVLTAEADSGGVLINPNGATLEVISTDQTNLDDRNTQTARVSIGLLDPGQAGNAARLWALYE